MHAGTTLDTFLRENLERFALASNWSMLCWSDKRYFEQGPDILGPYLPHTGGESNVPEATYSEGGDVIGYLRDALKNAHKEVVQHGAVLGLGIAGIGPKSVDAFDDLKTVLFTDSAFLERPPVFRWV
jgi:26S proteasome regulatory subunit N2